MKGRWLGSGNKERHLRPGGPAPAGANAEGRAAGSCPAGPGCRGCWHKSALIRKPLPRASAREHARAWREGAQEEHKAGHRADKHTP